MKIDKSLLSGSTVLLVLSLLEEQDQYGYQMIATLARRSDRTFDLKEGTLYPILHTLEQRGHVSSYESEASGSRRRKYYRLTRKGERLLAEKRVEWEAFAGAMQKVLNPQKPLTQPAQA